MTVSGAGFALPPDKYFLAFDAAPIPVDADFSTQRPAPQIVENIRFSNDNNNPYCFSKIVFFVY